MSLIKKHNITKVSKKTKKPKYKMGDMVYSYLNKTKKYPVNYISLSYDPDYNHKYKLAFRDKDGYSYSSKYIDEKSLSKKPIK